MDFIFFGWGIAIFGLTVAIAYFKSKFVWWEYAIMGIFPPILSALIYWIAVSNAATDVEFFTAQTVKVEYYEYWETYVSKTCTRTYECNCRTVTSGTGSNTTSHRECSTCTETYDCSYCDEYPAKYLAHSNTGEIREISQSEFNRIANKFGTKRFVELNRKIDNWSFCGKDGDLYVAEWDGDRNKYEPFCTSHTYENKIQLNKSFGFRDLTEVEKSRIHEYPAISSVYQPSIVGNWHNTNDINWARFLLDRFNGEYGKKKQIKAFIFTYYNQTPDVAELQKIYFKGGNKNEIIVCVGYDCCKATWVRAFSWTDEKICEVEVTRYFREDMKLYQMVEYLIPIWTANWKRKEFTPYNQIMQISPSKSTWWLMAIFQIILLVTLLYFFHNNEFKPIK